MHIRREVPPQLLPEGAQPAGQHDPSPPHIEQQDTAPEQDHPEPLRHQRTDGDALYPAPLTQHEEGRETDIDEVGDNADRHRIPAVLHPDEPPIHRIRRQYRRCSHHHYGEVDQRIPLHLRLRGEDGEDHPRERRLQEDDQQTAHQSYEEGLRQCPAHPLRAATPVGLRRETGGAHAEEGEDPVDEVEERRRYRDPRDRCRLLQVPRQPHVHQPEEGDGEIGDNIGKGEPQYAAVESRTRRGRHREII